MENLLFQRFLFLETPEDLHLCTLWSPIRNNTGCQTDHHFLIILFYGMHANLDWSCLVRNSYFLLTNLIMKWALNNLHARTCHNQKSKIVFWTTKMRAIIEQAGKRAMTMMMTQLLQQKKHTHGTQNSAAAVSQSALSLFCLLWTHFPFHFLSSSASSLLTEGFNNHKHYSS